mmetsp:Transcript_2783/g.6203  ORF Transcript_2783/g.6203 Transcript_2783/m.6203 type:complete len:556 (-) Transcript_2783:89-1756(-)
MSLRLLRTALVASIAGVAFPFAPSLPTPTTTSSRPTTRPLFSSESNDDDGGIDNFEEERMNLVRQLQRSYYQDVIPDGDAFNTTLSSVEYSSSNSGTITQPAASLDRSTGRINNLPLWRVGWVETPGRRNCLNVHEMQYTHMFEQILSQSSSSSSSLDDDNNNTPSLYFGHLYLPHGTKSSKSNSKRYQLKTWREELNDADRFDNYDSSSTNETPDISTPTVDRSAVIGCLMQIIDHRRMEDGRLMILVQALERFVVEEIVESKPYGVANVQILLDEEDLPWEKEKKMDNDVVADANYCTYLRGKAVDASFHYHDYEFGDRPKLPVAKNFAKGGDDCDGSEQYISQEDVPWVEISKLLPFAHYSNEDICLDAANKKTASVDESMTTTTSNDDSGLSSSATTTTTGEEFPLEQELWNGGITWDPPPVVSDNVLLRRSRDTVDCDALETLLWLALEEFCRATGFVLPEEVACLLPPEMDYLDIQMAESRLLTLSSKYPKLRRQRRLSYLAPALIENVEPPMKGMRQVWLNTPSTAARLLGALERYDYLNNKMMGQFE